MPGLVVEPLFLTDPAETRIALGASGQLALARGLLGALTSSFRSARAG
jgi:N-acetylmuramoyl-L-alanine amidase